MFLANTDPKGCDDIDKLLAWRSVYKSKFSARSRLFYEQIIGKSLLSRVYERGLQINNRIKELEDRDKELRESMWQARKAALFGPAGPHPAVPVPSSSSQLPISASPRPCADQRLLSLLKDRCAKLSVCGFVYFKRWRLRDGTCWYKVGITNNMSRRESEQNVLPVAAETLAYFDAGGMDRAKAYESAIHLVLDSQRIRDANNRELFHLSKEQELALIEFFKAPKEGLNRRRVQ